MDQDASSAEGPLMAGWTAARGEWQSDWVDWIESPDGEIILTQTGGFLRIAKFEPPDLETASRDDRAILNTRFTELLTMPGTGWSIWMTKYHLLDQAYVPRSPFNGNLAALLVDDSRRAQFADLRAPVFNDRHSIALHWAPQDRDVMLAVIQDQNSRSAKESLRLFRDQTDQMFAGMSMLCPSVEVLAEHGLGAELALPITFELIDTALPREQISYQIGSLAEWKSDISEGVTLFVDGLHVACIDVHVFGSITPETVEVLHELPFEYAWTTCLHCLDPDHQRRAIQWDRKRWEPKQFSLPGWLAVAVARDRSYGRERPDVAVALAELDELEAGLHYERDGLAISSMSLKVWSKDKNEALDRARTVVSHLNPGDMRSRISTFPALTAVADIPGNASRDVVNRRRPKVHISKMAKCSPLTGLTAGCREDQHLKGPALIVAKSRRRGPLFWPLHAPGSDVGHCAVVGPTGGGKSILASFAAAQFLHRYEDSTVTIFDKRCSAMVATSCLGGTWFELGGGGRGVQPLRYIDDPEDFAWATGWLQEALRQRNVIITSEVDTALYDALMALRALTPNQRTISALCAHLGGNAAARDALRYFTGSGALGQIADSVIESYGTARVHCTEYDPIMQPNFPAGHLIFAACFRHVERERIARGGHPKLLIIDEAWEPLGHPLFRSWLTNMSLTGRKLNMSLMLFTQSLRQLEAEHTAVIMEQCQTAIYTANSKATDPANARLYEDRGLSPEQVATIAGLRPKGEYLICTDAWKRVADITLVGDALRICGSSRPIPHIRRARELLADGIEPGEPFLRAWRAEEWS